MIGNFDKGVENVESIHISTPPHKTQAQKTQEYMRDRAQYGPFLILPSATKVDRDTLEYMPYTLLFCLCCASPSYDVCYSTFIPQTIEGVHL